MEGVHDDKGIIEINETINKEIDVKKQTIGVIIYIIVFIIGIPLLLYKNKYFTILEGYLPNVDLIANVLSWHGGPFDMWGDLYPSIPISTYGFISQSFVNYIALLGLTYIVAREVKLTGNVVKGWSIGFVMLLMTYLLPSNLVTHIMNKIKSIFNSKNAGTAFGFIISISIIILESFIIKHTRHSLLNIGKKIINFPKLF
tara:strand:+ start:1262 stop:1861 length:600 start_codon:yes stop_codon:yes gene_type:complete